MAWKKVESVLYWQPAKDGEELIGEMIKTQESHFGGKQHIIRNEEGVDYLTPSHIILRTKLDKILEGQRVKIVYLGTLPKKGNKTGNPAKNYDVFVDKD